MKVLSASLGVAIALLPFPAKAEEVPSAVTPNPVVDQPPAEQVLQACLIGQVTTLPNPYRDVSPDHWAYEAVLNLYYCGPIRPGLPDHLIDRLTGISNDEPDPLF